MNRFVKQILIAWAHIAVGIIILLFIPIISSYFWIPVMLGCIYFFYSLYKKLRKEDND